MEMDSGPRLDATFESRLNAQIDASRRALQEDPAVSLRVRKDRLSRMLELLKAGRASLLAALSEDFGRRSPLESDTIEILPLMMALRHTLRSLPGWLAYGRRSAHWSTWPAKAAVDYVPLGVIGIMSPWNYPLVLSLGPAIGALAAGNRVIFKPSEAVPHTNAVLTELLAKYFSTQECAMFQGGVSEAKCFASAPWDHLVFTGSTSVGRAVMQAAAESMVPVTLELGGCCPAWLDPSAHVAKALEPLLRGKLINAGQTCVAPNHLYCPASKLASLLQEAPKVALQMYPGGLSDPHYTSLIHAGQADRLAGWVSEAKSAGATWVPLLQGGEPSYNCIEPGMIIDPPEHLSIAKEEIFGPILVVRTYDDGREVIPSRLKQELVSRPHPLAAHIFSENPRKIQELRNLARCGMVVVNGPLVHVGQDALPFGGLGDSGVGHYHGQEGFLRFSHQRSYYRQMTPNALSFVFPPYGAPIKEKMLALLRKIG